SPERSRKRSPSKARRASRRIRISWRGWSCRSAGCKRPGPRTGISMSARRRCARPSMRRPKRCATMTAKEALRGELARTETMLSRAAESPPLELRLREIGTVRSVARGTVRVSGLPDLGAEELIELPGGVTGLAFNLDPDEVGVILLGD